MPEEERIPQPSMDNSEGQTPSFKEACFRVRDKLEPLKLEVLMLKENPDFKNEQTHANQHSEMKANIMLAYRHLEDARMRMGKALQAYDGKDCLPR